MKKGAATRQAILDHAVALASTAGLEGLTIGTLAEQLSLSKSGLFAHFQSKEALQVQVLEAAAAQFVDRVVRPALAVPRGEARLRSMCERWVAWGSAGGGCIFVGASFELDDRPGPVRDRLVALQADWLDALATCVRTGIQNGDFRADTDPEQVAHELYSAMLGFQHASRLMRDPLASTRLHRAIDRIVLSVRARVPTPVV